MRTRTLPVLPAILAIAFALVVPVTFHGVAAAQPCGSGSGISAADTEGGPPSEHAPLGRKPVKPRKAPPGAMAGEVGAAAIGVSAATHVRWVTGRQAETPTSSFYNRFGISGTDLGIMWDNGAGQTLVAFGDTFGDCSKPDDEWRYNTLFRTNDVDMNFTDTDPGNPAAGSAASTANFSKQIIDKLGTAPREVTVIPTAGISVDGVQYINFMSVQKWGSPGRWTTNYSATAVSEDNGETWDVDTSTIRYNRSSRVPGAKYIRGNQNFQMGAYTQDDTYVYFFGTPNGRGGSGRVARVVKADILDLAEYEYWTGREWLKNRPDRARAVLSGAVSELSVQWNEYLQQYIALYTNSSGVVYRTAPQPQGPWSSRKVIVSSWSNPGLYAPYIHPMSSGQDLYFALSMWGPYNVRLMKSTLTK